MDCELHKKRPGSAQNRCHLAIIRGRGTLEGKGWEKGGKERGERKDVKG